MDSFSSFVLSVFMIMDKLDHGFRDRQRKLVGEAWSTIYICHIISTCTQGVYTQLCS